MRVVSSLYTGSALAKRLAKGFLRWMVAPFHSVWRDGPGAEEFEARGLARMCALEATLRAQAHE